jgi:uncharacterized membrane protein YqjE
MNILYYLLLLLRLGKEDEILLNFENLLNNLTGYIESKVELTKIEVKEAVGEIAAKAILFSVLFFISIFTLIFLSLTIATLLNQLLDSRYLGFAIITAILILKTVIMFSMRESILKYLAKKTASMFNSNKK